MRSVIDAGEVLEVEVGVDLRAAYAGVPEEFLHCAQIAARLQKMARKTVTKHVRMHMHAESERARPRTQPAGDSAAAQAMAGARNEQRGLARAGDAGTLRQPAPQGREGLAAHRYRASTAALAAHRDQAFSQIEPTLDIESGEFGDPEP